MLLCYPLAPKGLRNLFLLLASLFFYTWGEAGYVAIMLVSIGANYVFGRLIQQSERTGFRKGLLIAGIVTNLGLLAFFKYFNFLIANINALSGAVNLPAIKTDPVHLPIGISFFTFQALSYVIDVYRKEHAAQRSLLNLAVYISMFPQLIAGPIVRYGQVARELAARRVDTSGYAEGIHRFIIGLAKKVIIANTMAIPADRVFSLPIDQISTPVAWLGIVCYTFQIYFDFSGYSDMAIGLGRMFGFHFPENFNYPYISKSIQEFWRRWHISLSTWFRDYLYIPLGGSRNAKPWRTYVNLVVVFFLCGLWHGASWSFVVWGLYHGLFLVLERLGLAVQLKKLPAPLRHVYAVLVITVGWVFFRSESLGFAGQYIQAMFSFSSAVLPPLFDIDYFNAYILTVLALSFIASAPVYDMLSRQWAKYTRRLPVYGLYAKSIGVSVYLYGLLFFCAAALASNTHNPFIYFRF